MAAAKYTIVVDQGTYWSKLFTYLDSEREPVDLTDYTAAMQIRPYHGSATVWVALTTDVNGGIVIAGIDGSIFVEMSDEQTWDILDDAVYDLNLISPLGEPERFLHGRVMLNPGVTV